MSEPQAAEPHYTGHRARLRAKLFEQGPKALHDYELLELLLGAAIPRRDVKPLAKQLLQQMSAWQLLQASPTALAKAGVPESAIGVLLAAGGLALRGQQHSLLNQPILNNMPKLIEYLQASLSHEKREQVRLLFLNRRNILIQEDVHQTGTIDHTPFYVREVVARCLEVGAGALIVVHNHPSGDPTPSNTDITVTQQLHAALAPLQITLHDHLIIGRQGYHSLRALGFLGSAEAC